jgi:branched-chain amino acid transport system ATP-binding protein
MARTFQTPRVFADMTRRRQHRLRPAVRGPAPRKYWLWGEEAACRGRCATRWHPAADRPGAQQAALPPAHHALAAALLEIGMALATRPRMLLLDEVAAGLTEVEIEAMARLIRRLRDELDLTVVWIEHAVPRCCVRRARDRAAPGPQDRRRHAGAK